MHEGPVADLEDILGNRDQYRRCPQCTENHQNTADKLFPSAAVQADGKGVNKEKVEAFPGYGSFNFF